MPRREAEHDPVLGSPVRAVSCWLRPSRPHQQFPKTAVNVKLLLPPRQSRGVSYGTLERSAGYFRSSSGNRGRQSPRLRETVDLDLRGRRTGFCSSFRDWAAERTNFLSEVAEMGLAHAVGDKVEAAYRRGRAW